MYALSEVPVRTGPAVVDRARRAVPRRERHHRARRQVVTGRAAAPLRRVGDSTLPRPLAAHTRRLDARVYRRRRLVVAVAVLALATVIFTSAFGVADRAVSERLLTVVAFGGWVWAVAGLWTWDRRRPTAGSVDSGAPCLALESASSLP